MECFGCYQTLGDEEPTFVCQHIALGVQDGQSCGFFFDEASERERPDAWCAACELTRQREGGAEAALGPAQATPICPACYDDARRNNGPWGTAFVMSSEKVLADCIQNVGTGPRRFPFWQRWGYLRPRKPRWAYMDDDIRPFYSRYHEALRGGRVTWGATVQVNPRLFEPGSQNHPGEVVFATDLGMGVDLIELRRVASRLVALKAAERPDRGSAMIAAYLDGELPRVFGLPVPERVSPRMPCAVSTVMFNRAHLPNGVLSQSAFPVLVTPGPHQVAVVLPSRFWPDRFRSFWVEGR